MYKITKMPLHAKITKIPQHQYFTNLSSNFIILPNYPHIRQLPYCPQFRLHKLITLSEITKLPSGHKITEVSTDYIKLQIKRISDPLRK